MPAPTVLEAGFPFAEVSQLIAADRRARDPVYGIHRWWARRPPALMRALLLAATTPASRASTFWAAYASDATPLEGLRVLDPFVGGGSTLVEAARLGAQVSGRDVDPLAVRIVTRELAPANPDVVREAGTDMLTDLSQRYGDLYPSGTGIPLHYFTLAEVACPDCNERDLLYRNLVIARDVGKRGAVVRGAKLSVFCPDCHSLHSLASAERTRLHCCGHYYDVAAGTFRNQRFRCRHCGSAATHRDLHTGTARRVLIAVEETSASGRRTIRPPTQEDLNAGGRAEWLLQARPPNSMPTESIRVGRKDGRPRSFGITDFSQLFSAKQLVVLGGAFDWIADSSLDEAVRDSLTLAVSNALSTNNRLCGYATDYGRIAPLFSVRGYSLPALAVELNPLHPRAGRGTLGACINRVARAGEPNVQRHVWDVDAGRATRQHFTFATPADAGAIRAGSADADQFRDASVDVCIFDPPYYDYINYDELADFHRSWLPTTTLAGEPLLPPDEEPASGFGVRLGSCLRAIRRRLRGDTPIAFTYHATTSEAWEAVGIALDEAKLSVTALWPVRSDGHMGHHSHAGNCEWDIVVVARPLADTQPAPLTQTVDDWVSRAYPLEVSEADRASMTLAIGMAAGRFAAVGSNDEASS